MSIKPDERTDVSTLLNQLKNTFEKAFEGVSSAKDVKKQIYLLIDQSAQAQQWEQTLRDQFSKLKCYRETIQPSDFSRMRDELTAINEEIRRLAAEADKDDFQALSEDEKNTIKDDSLLKRLRESYEFFLRLDEHKYDPRTCLFLAIFPQNAVLRKRFLIYWWIGEGLVENEEEGERVFEELLDLHLLLPHRTDKNPRVSKCRIFPLIRYMLIALAMKEKLLSSEDDIPPRFDPTNSQRACLIADYHTNLTSESEPKFLEKLRTIFNVNERELDFPHQWLAKLKRLVVLQLGRWQFSPTHHIEVRGESFLTGLKTQKFLKYLSLRGISRITALPESIKELISLQILDLKACHNLETLPDAIASLRKLTHLDVSECHLLERLPKGLDKLNSLQVLKGFIIGNSLKTPIRIKHLTTLENLKRLSIHIGSEASIQKDEFDKLKDLAKVKCLKISWGKADVEGSLSFPPELQKLNLEGFPHDKMPEWLKPSRLMNLKTLYIKGGKLKDLFDQVEKYRNVEYLVLKYTNMPRVNKEALKAVFPSLQYAKMVEWVKKGEREHVEEYEWNKE